jgi:hypothetical protein
LINKFVRGHLLSIPSVKNERWIACGDIASFAETMRVAKSQAFQFSELNRIVQPAHKPWFEHPNNRHKDVHPPITSAGVHSRRQCSESGRLRNSEDIRSLAGNNIVEDVKAEQ